MKDIVWERLCVIYHWAEGKALWECKKSNCKFVKCRQTKVLWRSMFHMSLSLARNIKNIKIFLKYMKKCRRSCKLLIMHVCFAFDNYFLFFNTFSNMILLDLFKFILSFVQTKTLFKLYFVHFITCARYVCTGYNLN